MTGRKHCCAHPTGSRRPRPTEPASNWGVLTADGASQVVPAEPGQWTSFYPGVAAAIRGDGAVPVDPFSALYAR